MGGWAQYVTVTAADLNCIRLPEGVDSLSAAALGCRYMTAYRAVVDRGRVQTGQWLAERMTRFDTVGFEVITRFN
jgi:propanol-preferring alcohol dehydrogenase